MCRNEDNFVLMIIYGLRIMYTCRFSFCFRKKHLLNHKDEVEKAIGFNKYTMDTSNIMENFHSPDTVCKSCGVDFKFFRALKHHLRSHTSCRTRPWQCQKCDMGFCTKANCIRHIQKQHKDVSDNQIESNIKILENFPMDDTDSIADSVSDDGIPLFSEDSRMTPFDMRSASGTPQPPAAHSTPKPASLSGMLLFGRNHVNTCTEIVSILEFFYD